MRGFEADRETKRDMKDNLIRLHEIHLTNTRVGGYVKAKDFECQYDSKIDNIICTCKPKRTEAGYYNTSRQIYRSQRYDRYVAKDFRDIGIGNVKTVYKKRIRRVYLPTNEDRGTGSTDLTPFLRRRRRNRGGGYYELEKTSSKCVGGIIEDMNILVLDKKVSPIIQTVSGTTSPKSPTPRNSKIISRIQIENSAKTNIPKIENRETIEQNIKVNNIMSVKSLLRTENSKEVLIQTKNKIRTLPINNIDDDKNCSSDSLLQHVHNLEDPSYDKMRISTDFIENKLEREYREMFTTREENFIIKEKPIADIKSATLLRRRFDALRRGLGKKEDVNREPVTFKISSKISVVSRRDVSIASDPPSLEARSYSNTKIHSPISSITNQYNNPTRKSYGKTYRGGEMTSNVPHKVDSDCQDVKGMFKLWEEKFNFEDNFKKISPNASNSKKHKKKVKIDLSIEEAHTEKKKGGKRFLFFGRKQKKKIKQSLRSKQGVTAGRCEVGDGLMIKIGNANSYAPEVQSNTNRNYEEYNISNKAWFKRFVTNRIDSRNSVRIRWNNSMYTTSSSTVFELMDCVYKNTGLILSSSSEISTNSSYYNAFVQPQVNFMQQNVQAWMIPKTITDIENHNLETAMKMINPKKKEHKIDITFPNKKWFIDKSKAFAQKIELVLHSKNLVQSDKSGSSEYIVIDIPQGYFSDISSDDKAAYQTSDEQVYNIVEYEALKSNSYLTKKKIKEIFNEGHNVSEDQFILRCHKDNESKHTNKDKEERILNRNILIQDSSVFVPKGCDVISVGIITQRDIRDIKKPILKINDDLDDESAHALPPSKTCEFAESFLQDYYRNWTPLGTDLLSWCLSDNKLRRPSEMSSTTSLKNQGDGSKSCSNIYDQATTIVSSCETSSCSHCIALDEDKKTDDSKASKFFSKFIKKNNEQLQQISNEKRWWPKDSLEVFKRRKIYSASNKSKWSTNENHSDTFYVPNKNSEQNIIQRPRVGNTRLDIDQKKKCKKRVLLQDCDVMNDILKEQLSDKIVEGILSFKGSKVCDDCKIQQPSKQTLIMPHPIREIPQPPCKESCIKENKPSCSKKNSPTCNVPLPPFCPEGPPSPCQKPCPPFPPPCRIIPSCVMSPPRSTSPKSRSNSTQYDHRKPIPPRIHSPRLSSSKRSRPCICPKKRSSCNIPKCPVKKTSSCKLTPPRLATSSFSKTFSECRSRSSCKCCKSRSSEKCKKSSSHQIPYSKTQLSHAKESELSLKVPVSPIENTSSKCVTALKRLIQKNSSLSIEPKDCKPECANRRRFGEMAPPTTAVPIPTKPIKSRPKISGLHLKKLPMPKNSSKNCLFQVDEGDGVIRLNSREKITIKLKQSTPSTEEIREGCNIKVQDEDGQTLYERHDYKKINKNRMQFVKDMYRDSHVQVQRLSTPNMDTVLDEKPFESNECKSDTSISNIIEINLNLKIKHGDKITELNINKEGDFVKKELDSCEVSDNNKIANEVYVVQDKQQLPHEDMGKQDVDIKIMIKNYKSPVKLHPTKKHSVSLSADDFSKKISEKFQTISTAYSDILEKHTYSIHRTTVGLTNSSDISKSLSKLSRELSSKVLTESIPNDTWEGSIQQSIITDITTEKKISSMSGTTITKSNTKIDTSVEITGASIEKSATSLSLTNDEYLHSDDTHLKKKSIPELRKCNRNDKKKILKKIFETASDIKKSNNNSKMQDIRHLLRAVLTSDSSHEAIKVNNNLAKELTYASLKSDYYNVLNDNTSNSTRISSKNESLIYPSEEITSEVSNGSAQQNVGCLCSRVANKLNITNNSCCCRKCNIDEEVLCNLINDGHSYIDVETQYSFSAISSKNLTNDVLKKSSKVKLSCKNDAASSNRKSLSKYSSNTINIISKCQGIKDDDPDHTLQLNQTKKAVLEIYAEKSISSNRHIVKLPKFINDIEKHIYETIDSSKKSVAVSIDR